MKEQAIAKLEELRQEVSLLQGEEMSSLNIWKERISQLKTMAEGYKDQNKYLKDKIRIMTNENDLNVSHSMHRSPSVPQDSAFYSSISSAADYNGGQDLSTDFGGLTGKNQSGRKQKPFGNIKRIKTEANQIAAIQPKFQSHQISRDMDGGQSIKINITPMGGNQPVNYLSKDKSGYTFESGEGGTTKFSVNSTIKKKQ